MQAVGTLRLEKCSRLSHDYPTTILSSKINLPPLSLLRSIEKEFMTVDFADRIQMQNKLFAELSNMFGKEVPLYDRSLAVNHACNTTVCALVGQLHSGFGISAAQLNQTSSERHGRRRS